MISLTPVLNVEKIEPSLDFWEKGLGFERPMEAPGEGGLAFVMLKQGDIEVMYQTFASLAGEDPSLAEAAKGGSNFLYIKVDNLNEVINNMKGFEVAVQRHQTFYGADEITYKEPGGHIVTFAEFKDQR
ncbi:MAG: VOC family protein [Alphaproteobacteria bacterium]